MSSSSITLIDVRKEAMDTIRKLKNKEIDIATAKEIRGCLDIVISVARTQVDFLNAIPLEVKKMLNVNQVKEIAGALNESDSLDITPHQEEPIAKEIPVVKEHKKMGRPKKEVKPLEPVKPLQPQQKIFAKKFNKIDPAHNGDAPIISPDLSHLKQVRINDKTIVFKKIKP